MNGQLSKIIFVDNNIPSIFAKNNYNPLIKNTVLKIWRLKNIKLVTSLKCKQEARVTRDELIRKIILLAYERVELIPPRNTLSVSGSVRSQDAERTLLRQIFKGKPSDRYNAYHYNDADHIFEASKVPCDFFLTLDKSSILNVLEDNREKVIPLIGKMEIVDPITLLMKLKNQN